jgi:hypothetical protein
MSGKYTNCTYTESLNEPGESVPESLESTLDSRSYDARRGTTPPFALRRHLAGVVELQRRKARVNELALE